MIKERKTQEPIAELFGTYKNLLMSISKKYLDNPQDCEEIIQDACVKALEKRTLIYGLTYNQQVTYIVKTVENLSKNKLKNHNNSKTVEITEEEWRYIPDKGKTVEKLLSIKDSDVRIRRMLDLLTPLDRTLLEGKYILGLTNKELARMIGCSTSTVAVKLHRAKKHAAALWGGKDFENE